MRSESDFADKPGFKDLQGGATLPFSMHGPTDGGVEGRQAVPHVRRDRQQNSDHRILQLVDLYGTHQGQNTAGYSLILTRQTLHP